MDSKKMTSTHVTPVSDQRWLYERHERGLVAGAQPREKLVVARRHRPRRRWRAARR